MELAITEFKIDVQSDIDMFEKIVAVSADTLQIVKETIQNSKYVKERKSLSSFLLFFAHLPMIRPASVSLYNSILRDTLVPIMRKFFNILEIPSFFNLKHNVLILLKQNFVKINGYYSRTVDDPYFFVYFYEEIRAANEKLFIKMINKFPEVKKIIDELENDQNKKEEFYRMREIGLNMSDFAVSIRNDDLESFLNIVKENVFSIEKEKENKSQNENINNNANENESEFTSEHANEFENLNENEIPEGNENNKEEMSILNSKIPFSIYEGLSLINDVFNMPSLIEYAAYYGSEKIFNFLLSKKVQLPKNLTLFASCGGSTSILQSLIQEKMHFSDGCFKVAVEYHRIDAANLICPHPDFFTLEWSLKNMNFAYFLDHADDFVNISCGQKRKVKESDISKLFTYACLKLPSYFVTFFLRCQKIGELVNDIFLFPSLSKTCNLDIIRTAMQCLPANLVDINQKDAVGFNALHYATLNNANEVIQFLIEQPSIDPNSKSEERFSSNFDITPLHFAARNGNVEGVKILLSHKKIEVNPKKTPNDVTPLMIACQNNHANVVKYLLFDSDPTLITTEVINSQDNEGKTALHYAVLNYSIDCIKLLAEKNGVDMNAEVNFNKQTAIHIATELSSLSDRDYKELSEIDENNHFSLTIKNNQTDFRKKRFDIIEFLLSLGEEKFKPTKKDIFGVIFHIIYI